MKIFFIVIASILIIGWAVLIHAFINAPNENEIP